jgi:hypothetical protein
MPRKIYDIKPPKTAKKTIKKEKKPISAKHVPDKVKEIKEFLDEEVIAKKEPVVKSKKEKKSLLFPISAGVCVLFLIICVYLFFKLPRANISIWPKVDSLSFQKTVIADKTANSVDSVKGIIPAQYFEATKNGSEDFLATGNADNTGKASGNITVFNKYSPAAPFTLKAGTHFVSDSGKLFVSLQKIIIPAAKKVGSKTTPGSVQVKVEAVEGGDSYNITASNFSVPGLKGSNYYFSIYASSVDAMSGGYSGKVKKITDDDIQGAKDVITKKLIDQATSDLKKQVTSDYVLADGAISTNITTASTQAKAGTIAEKFTYGASVKASALAFKKSDLDEFVKDYIVSQMPAGKTLLDNSINETHTITTTDITGGKITMNVNLSSGIYQNIDKNSLAMSLIGENNSQINQTINNNLGNNVSKIDVKFWPFWVKSAPNNQKVINISLQFK